MNIEVDGDVFVGPDGKPVHDDNLADERMKVLEYALFGAGGIMVVIICLKFFGSKSHTHVKDEDEIATAVKNNDVSKVSAKEEIELTETKTKNNA
mmetsp:Transcript_11279/g.9676  ORF Transcript_11279/g.9676 Transcript_11279/m.9676 type:complete len:95 (+) Transcript_11279:742-1026(+)|eukprot:CAMPEP_0114578280 /NCGR_PEP_ID=MMETSP0125-20121206/2836_1 /TAXON_ID=485358 ORGANISM="Aristerostoma sp., Strain ATCC 50986" /NCGR_SAMPLE_ID=MMETSP0125 /ASSEMBLY_ACC=CAM_ASM_000245 /LENGTH=94 /DNA_ID=CAMNT_0001768225 /DNA_START=6127 /DNA_END=6411 /DNA_ORIENTATION=-